MAADLHFLARPVLSSRNASPYTIPRTAAAVATQVPQQLNRATPARALLSLHLFCLCKPLQPKRGACGPLQHAVQQGIHSNSRCRRFTVCTLEHSRDRQLLNAWCLKPAVSLPLLLLRKLRQSSLKHSLKQQAVLGLSLSASHVNLSHATGHRCHTALQQHITLNAD
jgi:hypothetical protein